MEFLEGKHEEGHEYSWYIEVIILCMGLVKPLESMTQSNNKTSKNIFFYFMQLWKEYIALGNVNFKFKK